MLKKGFSRRAAPLFLCAVLSAGALLGCGAESGAGDTVFGDFTAPDLDGNEITQEVFSQAEVTMVNIWGTFCGPCIREMPELGELSKEYADQGLQIVGIVIDALDSKGNISESQTEAAKTIVEETGADYLHLLPSMDLVTAKLQSVTGVPTTVFVDSEGRQIGKEYQRSYSKEDWQEIIGQILEEAKK